MESTTIRIALYIKSGYTTFWIWWHKALEKRVGLSSKWDTLEEKRDVRHINLGFYEEWLRTEARLKYMAKTYPQTFTKIYMVTKPDFVVKPDTEYVVIIMRVDGEFRTIACPREIFLETKLGDIIMGMKDDELESLGLGDANISGFSEGKIGPYIYGLITMSDATSTTWSKVVAAITQNTSGVRIASIVQMSKILLPKDIVKMIPLNVLPQQGKSLPEYMSPEASIWAAMVGFVSEVGRLLCELFMALANFLVKFLKTIAEWGLKLLGALLQVLDVAKYLFAMALSVWSWIEAATYMLVSTALGAILYMLGVGTPLMGGFALSISSENSMTISLQVISVDYYGFPVAFLRMCFISHLEQSVASILGLGGQSYAMEFLIPFVPFLPMTLEVTSVNIQTAAPYSEESPFYEGAFDFLFSSFANRWPLLLVILMEFFIAAYMWRGDVSMKLMAILPMLFGFHLSFQAMIPEQYEFESSSLYLKSSSYGGELSWLFTVGFANVFVAAIYFGMMATLITIGYKEFRKLVGIISLAAGIIFLAAHYSHLGLPSEAICEAIKYYGYFASIGFVSLILKAVKYLKPIYMCVSKMIRKASVPLLASLCFLALTHLVVGSYYLDNPQLWHDIEFTPPSITVSQCDITPSEKTATINARITVEDNKQLHYVVIDLAKSGGGDSPHTSEGYKSRIEARGVEIIVPRVVEIHRRKTGDLDICVLGGKYSLSGDGSVEDTISWEHTVNGETYSGSLYFKVSRAGETITVELDGDVYHDNINSSTTLYLVTWTCDWIDNEALSVSDCPQSRTYISSHKQLLVSHLVLAEGLYSRVFTIGYRPYQCLDYVGIEFSSQSRVVLLIGGSNVTYSSPNGLWGAVAINASAWDVLCSYSPAKFYIGGRVVDIHFLRVPFYYTLYGLMMLGSLSMYGVLRYEKGREKNL